MRSDAVSRVRSRPKPGATTGIGPKVTDAIHGRERPEIPPRGGQADELLTVSAGDRRECRLNARSLRLLTVVWALIPTRGIPQEGVLLSGFEEPEELLEAAAFMTRFELVDGGRPGGG